MGDKRTYGLWGTVLLAVALALFAAYVGVGDLVMLVLFCIAAPVANLYVLFYWFRPWRSTRQGEALMVKAWGNVILLNLGFATLVFGRDYVGRDFFRVLGMTGFAVGICYLLGTLLTTPGADEYPPRSWFRRRRSSFDG